LNSGTSQSRASSGRPFASSASSIIPLTMMAPAELSLLDSVPSASMPMRRGSSS
jgi:hypothetical protein